MQFKTRRDAIFDTLIATTVLAMEFTFWIAARMTMLKKAFREVLVYIVWAAFLVRTIVGWILFGLLCLVTVLYAGLRWVGSLFKRYLIRGRRPAAKDHCSR